MVSLSATFVVLLSGVVSGVLGWELGPVNNLKIVNAQISPDGFSRSAVLPEGQFPGPPIVGWKGDHFSINVIDELTDESMVKSTSVHWHGLFQKTTNWADGPSFVNQCPIAPGHSFLYDFHVPDQAGTFWYHSHLSTQYCDGLRGAFVVYDPNDPYADLYDVDDESTIITLADWYHYVSPQAPAIPSPNSTLINGLGRYKGGPESPLAVINVVQGMRYRFRLIAMSCAPNYVFSIDGHNMTIIEADGENTKPLTVDSIRIFASQRYSFVFTANQPVDNYWVRANPNIGTTGFDGHINQAILRYIGAPEEEPKTGEVETFSEPLDETHLHALIPGVPGAPNVDGADVNLNLIMGFNLNFGLFTINGNSFVPPTVPVLLQILSGSSTASELLPSGSVFPLPLDKVIQITFSSATGVEAPVGGPHPFHLHGHSFDVVRSAGSKDYNWVNPVRRDVVNTGRPGDNVTIRFKTDNAGPWFLHCHIDWHLDAGFAVVLAEDIPGTNVSNPRPEAWNELCPIYNKLTATEKGGIVPSTTNGTIPTTPPSGGGGGKGGGGY